MPAVEMFIVGALFVWLIVSGKLQAVIQAALT